jgi:hypothetical protein
MTVFFSKAVGGALSRTSMMLKSSSNCFATTSTTLATTPSTGTGTAAGRTLGGCRRRRRGALVFFTWSAFWLSTPPSPVAAALLFISIFLTVLSSCFFVLNTARLGIPPFLEGLLLLDLLQIALGCGLLDALLLTLLLPNDVGQTQTKHVVHLFLWLLYIRL